MGEARFDRFLGAFDEEAPVSIRVNPKFLRKEEGGKWKEFPQKKVPWCPEGYYLSGRPQFTFDPLFHAGCYYVQEAASMFVTHILRTLFTLPSLDSSLFTLHSSLLTLHSSLFTLHSSPFTILDLCAAPGGKSTAMRTVLPEGSLLVSNEPIPTRAQILLENITKWGWPDCIVTNNYPRDFRKAKVQFDLILCDVPCSGEGMFRKDPATIGEWSPQNVEKCWRLQREIVADAWECLSPGGLLIYSTCTYNIKENEENVRWILETYDAEPVTIPTDPSWNITGSLLPGFDVPVYRFIPGITRSEGLFLCVLRKPTPILSPRERRLITPANLSKLKCIQPPSLGEGMEVGISYSDALRYLRGEALVLPPDTPRGIVTVTYRGVPLGPAKNIGSRANNLYPKPWRIKTTHLPSTPVEIICKL